MTTGAPLWSFPDPIPNEDLVGVGADLTPATLLYAYSHGLFPMRVFADGPIGWWSPDPRGVLPLENFRFNRSLRRAQRNFLVTVNTAFEAVMRGCADPARPHGWIDGSFVAAYVRLHQMGFAHSVEVWEQSDSHEPVMVGGVYGVAMGGLFAGESMFSRTSNASKVALAALVTRLRVGGGVLFDVQWRTDHLASMGAVEISRFEYLAALTLAVGRPQLTLAN